MANILAPRTLGVTWAAGSILLLCLSGRVQSQQAAGRPEGSDKPAASQQAAEIVQLREDLTARRAKMREIRIRQARIKAELEIQLIEIRAVEKRLKEATALIGKQSASSSAAEGGRRPEQRLQRLEQQVRALLTEAAPRREQAGTKFSPLDFQALANQKRKESFHSGTRPANTLESLSSGEHKLLKVPFQIGDGVLQVGSTELQDKPPKITGIKVGKKLANLHFLHATAYFLEEQVSIGSYTVHYADGASEIIRIVNGKDVTDWWKYPFSKAPTSGKVAWEGANEDAKESNATLWLFLTTWQNPRPNTSVTSIDFASTMDTRCAPFCVAITAEEP